ncbi:hypothetical protein F4818DRAFT_336998 [Hypoxylon cercidicola]|nr:hypothetical protein F4818DRAFT_336998 [Hypoxylon cercidicola]
MREGTTLPKIPSSHSPSFIICFYHFQPDIETMCKELYQRWHGCTCWGFLRPQTCTELFKKCLGPRGEVDKLVIKWNDGLCNECWDRLMQEAREMVDAEEEAEAMAAASASASSKSRSNGS